MLLYIIFLGVYNSGRILRYHNLFSIYDKIFQTILSFLVFLIIFKVIIILIHGLKDIFRNKPIKFFDKKFYPFFEKGLKLVVLVIYLFFIFKLWNIDLTPLLAGAGLAGLALAFVAQDSISNILGGVSVFADRAYEIGDYVVVDNKHRGEVIDIGMRSTKIKTRDNVMIVVPNSIMANTIIVNESGIHPELRVRIDIDVAYGADLEKAEKILLDITKKAEYAEKNPLPRVRYRSFGKFSMKLQLLFWIKKPELRGRYVHYVIKDIYKRFNNLTKKGYSFLIQLKILILKKCLTNDSFF